ncbi:T9SS type A sorting domain-containing protein [Mucilaginibacter paludis]|uniref:Lysyl endopeptidase n=1 Tax=Mucilaginibacter paludis DSM 18603 TaxID=714943 RepID=H1YHZ8_9SPHI|nr:T9SS type A sorting domain-containing protein [Mucilaginibacter paludis]EHQ25546.1 Lysyl endopeptidase [Mucilaginibacter paludis DSM 18603]
MKKILMCMCFSIVIGEAMAQIPVKRIKITADRKLTAPDNPKGRGLYTLAERIDTATLFKEDEAESKLGLPFRFGKGFAVDLGFGAGKWMETTKGRIWQLQISSDKAYSLNLVFDDLELADGCELMINNTAGNMQVGPYTSAITAKNHYLATDIIEGNSIILTLFEPASARAKSKLHISKIVHGYKRTFSDPYSVGGYGQSSSCEVNVNCSQGANWVSESNGVAMILLSSGDRLCSGSMITDVCQDLKTYFLTAFHCVDSITPDATLSAGEKNAVGGWLFRFNYKSPTCSGSEDYDYLTYNGSTFRAAYQQSDFALVELMATPLANSGIYYNGWSRSTTGASSSVMIHHPKGDVMKISTDNNAVATNSSTLNFYLGSGTVSFGPGTHWQAVMTSGGAEQGSSGSPLLNQNHQIVGQLHGGTGTCPGDANFQQLFGRFDVSWDGGGTADTRLKDWLDPGNTNASSVGGLPYPLITGAPYICSSETYTITGLPAGVTPTWAVTSPMTITSSTANTVTVASNNTNQFGNLTATYAGSCGNITATLVIQSGNPFWYNGIIYGDANPICVGGEFYYNVPTYPYSVGGYTWDWLGVDPNSYAINGNGNNSISLYPFSPTNGTLRVQVNGPCGVPVESYTYVESASCSSSFAYTYYPNPATNQITVSSSIASTAAKAKIQNPDQVYELFEARIYSDKGRVLASAKNTSVSKYVVIDTSQIPSGTYYLHILKGKETIKKQIIISH